MEHNSCEYGHSLPPDVSSYIPDQAYGFPDQPHGVPDISSHNVPTEMDASLTWMLPSTVDLNEPAMDVDESFAINEDEVMHDGLLTDEQILEKKFDSEEEAYDWYRIYALTNGFGIRRDNRRSFDEYGHQIKSRIFVCARQGRREQKHYDRPDRKREHRSDTRCSCTARLRISRTSPSEKFSVTHFNRNHEHDLADPNVTYKLRSHRKVTDYDVEYVVSLKEVGMRVCDAFQLQVSQAGGFGKVGYMVKDLYNRLQTLRQAESNSGDGQLALQYLDTLEHTHGGVFKRFTLGEIGQLHSLFWCDLRCQQDWDRFGDVLVFDSTYKCNMYLKPLLILSGVNNHFQTTVFAVAVLHNETTETYTWVLNCFKEAMGDKLPISVITDGDLAMKAAIADVFPDAKHRLCLWHLCRNAEGTLKLGSEFMKDFGKCLRKRSSINQWNDDWQHMVDKWCIANKKWVQSAHMTRHLWAEAFLKDTFFAGQTKTQRCESINKFFKQYLKCTNNIVALCKGFMCGLEKLHDNERGQHCISDQGNPVLTSQFKELKEHAALFYTRAVYFKFKEQALKAAKYTILEVQELGDYGMHAFYIKRQNEGSSVKTVLCLDDNSMLNCSCMEFESSKMICGHIIFVLYSKNIVVIPENLLSKRWEKTDREYYKNEGCMKEPVKRQCDDPKTQAFRRGCMRGRMERLSDLGGTSQVTYDIWKEGVESLIHRINNTILNEETQHPWIPRDNPQAYAFVRPPSKGETRAKGSSKNVPKRYGNCKQFGHNRTTCPNPPADLVQSQSQSLIPSQSTQEPTFYGSGYSLPEGSSHTINFSGQGHSWI